MGNKISQNIPSIANKPSSALTLLNQKKENADKKVVAVIVSFVCNSTYDELFTSVEQKSDEGTKVLVYSCSSRYLPNLIKMLEGAPTNENDRDLLKNIN